MAQFVPVLTNVGYQQFKERQSAMAVGATDKEAVPAPWSSDQVLAAEELLFKLPEFSWSFEVDILGGHRITIHFEGAEISVDE